eukprot:XP_014044472.1 PREDICTED: zinc finger protein AEBP2-like isoform X1 [Salmo salar]
MCGTGDGGSSTSSDRGNGGTSSGGDRSTSSGGDRSTSSGGDRSTSSGGDRSTSSGGDRSRSSGGDRSRSSGGDRSRSSGGDRSTSSGGDRSTSSGGDRSTSSGGDRSTSSGGDRSTSSGDEASPNVRPSARPQPSGPFLPVDSCGEKPTVDNGDFISDSDRNRMALTFKCINYYKLVGPEQVMCHSDKTWSKLPICKAPCTIDKRTFYLLDLKKDMFVKEGESQTFLCKETDYWKKPFVADVRCLNGDVTTGSCTLGCKLDARRYYWLDLTQDMFLKDERQTLNCKQKDYWGRPLVANVQCQNGYLTSNSCYQLN